MWPFLTNPLVQKLLMGASVLAVAGSFYYGWHVKPIKDLQDQNTEKQEIIDKAKDKVEDSNSESNLFEDKWKDIKDLIFTDTVEDTEDTIDKNTKDINGTEKSDKPTGPTDKVDTSLGEHSITL